jgi:hypothetical protein
MNFDTGSNISLRVRLITLAGFNDTDFLFLDQVYISEELYSLWDGQARNNLAKVNATTGALDRELQSSECMNNTVRSLALSGSDLYLGGSFTTVGGQTRNRLAKVNATTGALDESFDPNVVR